MADPLRRLQGRFLAQLGWEWVARREFRMGPLVLIVVVVVVVIVAPSSYADGDLYRTR